MTLTITGLTVRYGDTVAVDDVSLEVPTGEILALVGPSGCGKSTLLRAVAGLVVPNAGEIAWDGSPMTALATHERDVGLMFQSHALFTHRSVAENIGFGLKMAGVAAAPRRERVEQLLDLVGLEGFGPRAIEGLSGGEAQRVALARALAPEPRLLLLDEPLASLDRARRVELNAELGRLLRELDQTAIYVTHDQEEAFSLADDLGVLHDGALMRHGPPAEVWRDPQSEVVARFLGHETIIERNGRRFAVRPDAVTVADTGDIVGRVVRSTFQGDRFEVGADVDGTPWRFFHHTALVPDDTVTLAIDPTKLAPL